MKLNDKIYTLRKRLGLSQEDLADALHVSRQSVSNWETGAAKPEIGKLPQLAKTLGVSIDFLLDEEAEVAGPEDGRPEGNSSETASGGDTNAGSTNEAAGRADHAAPGNDAENYPEWLDRLPCFLQRSAHRYGWIFGIRYAIAGLLFVIFGFVGRALVDSFFHDTGSMDFGKEMIITSGNLPRSAVHQIEDQLGATPSDSSFMYIIPNAAIIIGVIVITGGLILAYALRQWGKNHQVEDAE